VNRRRQPWSGRKAFGIGALIESVLIAPAALLPWGHAGPETTLGWLGVIANAPGLFVSSRLVVAETDLAISTLLLLTFVIQAALIGGLLYAWQRWRGKSGSN
jgi:hypothetical protein